MGFLAFWAAWAVASALVFGGWFWWDMHVATYGSARSHRRYLKGLQRRAMAEPEYVRAAAALTDEDRGWLKERGWEEPGHVVFVRVNRLEVDDLPLPKSRLA